jgi:methylmalonyl-CoA/ethylmalonyl-CoA epimerase
MSVPAVPPGHSVPTALRGVVQELHHVAIAVKSIAEARKAYEAALGLTATELEFVPGQKVNVLVLYAGAQRIELVEPASPDSAVVKFLEQRGGGVHHLAWRVDDMAAALAHLKSQGIRLIDEVGVPGAHGCTIAFVHPKSTGGVLMELVQEPRRGR